MVVGPDRCSFQLIQNIIFAFQQLPSHCVWIIVSDIVTKTLEF